MKTGIFTVMMIIIASATFVITQKENKKRTLYIDVDTCDFGTVHEKRTLNYPLIIENKGEKNSGC
jgi:hypothetical protein